MALLFRGCTKYLPAQDLGGGIAADEGHVKLWLSQCEFLGNKAAEGGVIALLDDLKSAEAEISFCSFKTNRATGAWRGAAGVCSFKHACTALHTCTKRTHVHLHSTGFALKHMTGGCLLCSVEGCWPCGAPRGHHSHHASLQATKHR